MIALKVEKLGDQVVVVLTEEVQRRLGAEVGGFVHLEGAAAQETWADDPHARGRAFLKRYNKSFARLES